MNFLNFLKFKKYLLTQMDYKITKTQVLNLTAGITTRQLTYASFGGELAKLVQAQGWQWGVGRPFSTFQFAAWNQYKAQIDWVSQAKKEKTSSVPVVVPLETPTSSFQRQNLRESAVRLIRNSAPLSLNSDLALRILQASDNPDLTASQASLLDLVLQQSLQETEIF